MVNFEQVKSTKKLRLTASTFQGFFFSSACDTEPDFSVADISGTDISNLIMTCQVSFTRETHFLFIFIYIIFRQVCKWWEKDRTYSDVLWQILKIFHWNQINSLYSRRFL